MLSADPDTNLLGTFLSTGGNMKPLYICKNFYIPTPFVRLFVEHYLTTVEAWNRLCGAIIDGGLEVGCRPIINWLRVDLTLKTGDEKPPLAMLQPTMLLENGDLLRHQHNMLTRQLPGLDNALQRVQGLLIVNRIGEVAVEMNMDREAKAMTLQADEEKGIPDLLGYNLAYLLHLG